MFHAFPATFTAFMEVKFCVKGVSLRGEIVYQMLKADRLTWVGAKDAYTSKKKRVFYL